MKTTDLFRNFKKLTADEERHYAETDRMILVERNLPLVAFVINKYFPNLKKEEFDDAYQEGVLGLIRAATKFDPDRARFSTYASTWVRSFIGRHCESNREIHIPNHVVKLVRIRDKLIAEGMTENDANEAALERYPSYGTKVARNDFLKIYALANVSTTHHPSDHRSKDNGNDLLESDSLFNQLPDPEANTEERAYFIEIAEQIEAILTGGNKCLKNTERNIKIIRERLTGLYLEELATKHGLTRQRIQQIVSLKQETIRKFLEEDVTV